MSIVQEFKEFAVKGNVIDLAVGVIIGAAFGKIVDSVVADLIMPLVGLRETPLPIPATISEPVLPGPGAPMGAVSVAAPASPETKG